MKQAEKNKLSTEKIINAAIRELMRGNLSEISVNRLCKENNISKGMLYHYFTSKNDLYIACLIRLAGNYTEAMAAFNVDMYKSVEENLHNFFEKRISYWENHSYDYFIIRNAMISFNQDDYEAIKQHHINYINALKWKMGQIIKIGNNNYGGKEEKLILYLRIINDNMFIEKVDKIIYAYHSKNYEEAYELKKSALVMYDDLLQMLLYGAVED
ncbi:MAG: TetR/AcrR family transcriptional regulator [Clostridiales bacterium]|nr:TetR/AcrR family transcriptional regulator [Clostridiales bacterium]